MKDENALFLCRPCAEKIKDFKTVHSVKIGSHRRNKSTCEQCGKRRFGYMCNVVFADYIAESHTNMCVTREEAV